MNHEFTYRRRAAGRWLAAALRLAAAFFLGGAIACGGGVDKPQPGASQPVRYDLKGKVVSIDRSARRVTLDHEAIPGLMGAMTMAYPVKDAHALDTLAAGDEVTAKLVSSDGTYWLEDISVPNRKS
jgi:protein SCO1/2